MEIEALKLLAVSTKRKPWEEEKQEANPAFNQHLHLLILYYLASVYQIPYHHDDSARTFLEKLK